MVDHGTEFGADLYELYRAGARNMPDVAQVYSQANHSIAYTNYGLGSAFMRDPKLGGLYGPAYEPWKALRDELQTMLGDMSKNLDLVGDALVMAAAEYAKADVAARDELERLKKENGSFEPPNVKPPEYPTGS